MNTIIELNNIRKDADYFDGKFNKQSPVVEIFSAMVNGQELNKYGKKADPAVNYIKDLGKRASDGDQIAITELNTLRRFVIEAPVMEEIKTLSVFGSYQSVGFGETIEREITLHTGDFARQQAANGDVVFPGVERIKYAVPTFTVSGGYAVDYRRVANGDMTAENQGMQDVKTQIRNKAFAAIVAKVYDAIKEATGVKYQLEANGLTKVGVDDILMKVRRFGKPTVLADYAVLMQFSQWAGYVGQINSTAFSGISEKTMNELASNGILSSYNGAILAELPNPYDVFSMNATGDNFNTLMPAGLAFVVPTGTQSPIATYTKGGLTSMSGNNVHTGKLETRFDLEVGCDVAKTQEHMIATIYDGKVGGLDITVG